MKSFDYCVITASNEQQAESFRTLLNRRIEHELYPREIQFVVVADPPAGRIGSGGGTLWALSEIVQQFGGTTAETPQSDPTGPTGPTQFLSEHRILILHAGGESRRLPCYAPEGKLFAPVPAESNSVFAPVVLDLQLNLYLRYPWHDGEVVVGSGDVIIDFDTQAVPDNHGDVCGFAKTASVAQGSRHGVFVFDAAGEAVLNFYQKADEKELLENAAFEGTDECALDIGIVSFSARAAGALLQAARQVPADGKSLIDALAHGEATFDLYNEIMLAYLPGLSYPAYRDRVQRRSGSQTDETGQLFLETIYEACRPFPLHGVLTKDCTFLHPGSLAEFPAVCRRIVGHGLRPFYALEEYAEVRSIVRRNCIGFNVDPAFHERESNGSAGPDQAGSDTVAPAGEPSEATGVTEGCDIFPTAPLAPGSLLVGLDTEAVPAPPAGFCVERRSAGSRDVYLVYSATDSFKFVDSRDDVIFCGVKLTEWLRERSIPVDAVCPAGDDCSAREIRDVSSARLFGVLSPAAVAGYWDLTQAGERWTEAFLSADRFSIRELNETADVAARDERRAEIRGRALRRRILGGTGWRSLSAADACRIFGSEDAAELQAAAQRTEDPLLKQYRVRIAQAVSTVVSATNPSPSAVSSPPTPELLQIDFGVSHDAPPLRKAMKDDQIAWARCPVRFDLAGGWTDTPPYTNRYGGEVVNIAANLNGQPPIQVFVRPTSERHIRVHSIDLGVTETFRTTAELSNYRDPSSAFSLPKAALCLLGLGRTDDAQCVRELSDVLSDIGCGIEITLLCAVPKGSGLGTSSILGGTILAGLQRFFGIQASREDLFLGVLQMEQMLTTGGGWQDQVGGIAGGVKYVFSLPGLRPNPMVHQLDVHLFTAPECLERFTLFYTGITRLAKNILQDVVSRINDRSPAYLYTHHRLKELARTARRAVELRDMNALAGALADSWTANKLIHESTTNDEVDTMLAACRPYYRSVKLLGAGGGGYALFVSETRKQAQDLRELLADQFENQRSRIVDFSLSAPGLQVSIS